MKAWLLADFRGRPRWVWLVCLALIGLAALWWNWAALSGLPIAILALLKPSRVPQPADVPDPARAAQDAHRAALETDRALAGVARESAQREAQGVERAQTANVDALIREHNAERRGRGQR